MVYTVSYGNYLIEYNVGNYVYYREKPKEGRKKEKAKYLEWDTLTKFQQEVLTRWTTELKDSSKLLGFLGRM
jgi:hypothetical protein